MSKKLLILIFSLLLTASATARDSLNIWVGGEFTDYTDADTWKDTVIVSSAEWIEIPVYLRGRTADVFISDICFPLGCQLVYIDSITGGDILYPFSNWDVKYFDNFNDEFGSGPGGSTPLGWISYSFLGLCRVVNPTNPWFPGRPGETPGTEWPNIVHCYTFNIHTVDDTLLFHQVICNALGSGVDYVQGGANAGDTLGGVGYFVNQHFACLHYYPNHPPIIDPDSTFSVPYLCGYTDFTVLIDIFDNEGDSLTVTASFGSLDLPITLVDTDQPGGPATSATYTYEIDFDMDAFCGDCWTENLVITAQDTANVSPSEFIYPDQITIIGELVADIGDADIWPGEEEFVPIYLDACGGCFCLGGFKLTICYDASVLNITEVLLGTALEFGERWVYNIQTDGGQQTGMANFIFTNDLNNCDTPPDICDIVSDDPIFFVKFLLEGGLTYDIDFCTPVCFCPEGDYEANNVTDKTGYYTWMPIECDAMPPDSVEYGIMHLEIECGMINILNEHNIAYGDINLNGYPFESGDVVLLANYLGDPLTFPFSLRQMIASDVNRDDLRATIADLIFMLNMLNGFSGPKLAPIDVLATVTMPEDASGNVNVMINSETSVGGAVVTINHAGVELGEPFVNGMNLNYSDNGDVMTVVVYNMEAIPFAAGSNVLFTVPVLGEGELTFGDVSISDNRGALLDARSELSVPIPTEFTVSQNFPNPFNANTRINFTVPADADVNIAIYNVAGQLVEKINLGKIDAGYNSIVWNAKDIASSMYFYKVTVGDEYKTRKMMLLK